MSLHHNPRIVTDGLVLAYDMDNAAKSWKGKPTENLASSNFFDGNVNFTTDETIQDTLPTGKKGDVRYLNADYVVDPNRTVSIGSYTLTAGDTYTLSFYVKNINCTGFAGNLYSPTLTAFIGSITYPTVFTDRWTRVTKTFTIPTDTVSAGGNVVMSPQVFRDGGNGFFKLAMLQLEEGSFATPWVNGTRSNTQALLDMSKSKNTITATSLTYNSDGTFEFDGTSDYITIPEPNVGLSPNSWTIEGWINPENQRSFFINPNSNGIDNFLEYDNTNKRIAVKVCESADTNERYFYSNSQSVPLNTWSHFSASISNLNVKLYINGANHVDQTETISMSDWSGIWHIGRRANGTFYLDGSLSNIKIYNRALTAAEIKQNFNATRGRFGI